MNKKEVEQLKRWLRRVRLSCAKERQELSNFGQAGDIAFGMESAYNFAIEKIEKIEKKKKASRYKMNPKETELAYRLRNLINETSRNS